MPIQNFSHRGLDELFHGGATRRIQQNQQRKLLLLMDLIAGAGSLEDFVGVSRFHALRGDRRGTYAFNVTANWRLTFRFEDGEAADLNYEDYH
jgi:proteic killer suppression protein